jgi:DNA-binding NarL/FixJ family response regulator
MGRKKIRVLLADDHAVLREGLRTLLGQEPDIEVAGEVKDGRNAVSEAARLNPDVVVMDIGMPGLNGIDATRRIVQETRSCRVLCLSVHREKQLINAMLEAGASGYLLKSCVSRELVEAIRTAASGESYLSPPIAADVLQHHVRGGGSERNGAYSILTEREREVLQLIAEGHHTKIIADRLDVSSKTILAHRENIMKKLNIDSVAALTRYALREGITNL